LITAIQTATDSPNSNEAQVIDALNALRTSTDANLQKAMITTYTYNPLIGISTVTDPKGDTQTYHYDEFNRLQFVKDSEDNILSENAYHYRTPN
jgi:YD repeat-containing protein